MDNDRTPDPPGQAPAERVIGYTLDGWSSRHLDITLHDITAEEAYRVLDLVQRMSGARIHARTAYLVYEGANDPVRRGPNVLTRDDYLPVWAAVQRRFPRALRHGEHGRLVREVAEAIDQQYGSTSTRPF